MRLTDFNLNTTQIGSMFIVMPLFYIPVSVCASYFPSFIERRVLTIVSVFCCVPAFLCAGPSEMINFPDELWLLGVGQALIGLFTPLGLCVGLSEMGDATERIYPG